MTYSISHKIRLPIAVLRACLIGLAVFTTATASAADPNLPVAAAKQTCAGYPVLSPADLGPLPKGMTLEEVKVNPGPAMDRIARYHEGGSALYINCDNTQYYRAVVSKEKLQVRPAKAGGWASLFIEMEGEEWEASAVIDGQLYRLDFLPFTFVGLPDELLIEHDGTRFSLPFDNCKALGLNAPLYGFDRPPAKEAKNPGTLRLEHSHAKFTIESESQEAYGFGRIQAQDLNLDGTPDAVLLYGERSGSGAETYAALLLGCGDGRFALSGTVEFGQVGEPHPAPLQVEKRSVCGSSFTTLVAQHSGNRDIERPNRRPPPRYDLYLYRPELKDFVQFATAMKPFPAEFNPADPAQCAGLLKERAK